MQHSNKRHRALRETKKEDDILIIEDENEEAIRREVLSLPQPESIEGCVDSDVDVPKNKRHKPLEEMSTNQRLDLFTDCNSTIFFIQM